MQDRRQNKSSVPALRSLPLLSRIDESLQPQQGGCQRAHVHRIPDTSKLHSAHWITSRNMG